MISRIKIHLSLMAFLIALKGFPQEKKMILKSWIKREVYDLSINQKIDDTLYTRYSFLKNSVYISFNPGWNDNKQTWSMSGNQLTIGMSNYIIQELTDSTLIIFYPGFRRIILDDEEHLNKKQENLPVVGQFNGEPVYEANKYITPRYQKEEFRKTIEQNLEGYNIRKATTFTASFVVKKDGTVDNLQIIKGITDGFNAEVCKQIKKTSKEWKAPIYKGLPISTRMVYTIKYLDSIVK